MQYDRILYYSAPKDPKYMLFHIREHFIFT